MAFFKNLWIFIKSRRFLIHLGIYLITMLLFLWIVFRWLDMHTGHGDFVEVPDFTGIKIPEIKEFTKTFGLRDTIIDSVYDAKKKHGIVVSQDPEPKSKVKRNRMVYLYVTSYKPQSITMPSIENVSPRQAIQILESYGLKFRIKNVPGPNYVLRQSIEAGKVIPKGSMVYLNVGSGDFDRPVAVPKLLGMHRSEAIAELGNNYLEEGAFVCPSCKTSSDSSSAVIFRQSPPAGEMVSSGSSVDIFLTLDNSKMPADSAKKTE